MSSSEIPLMKVPTLDQPAPQFEGTALVDGEFQPIKLSDFEGKYLILFFYPLDFTFVCPPELLAFSDAIADFRKLNCEVVGAATDGKFAHLAWTNTPRKRGGLGGVQIPLLADRAAEVARSYGVFCEDADTPYRGLFIIDDRQILRQVTLNGLLVPRSVDETLRLVRALQYTDAHGQVCPVGLTKKPRKG